MKNKNNGNLNVDEQVRQKKEKEREFIMQCCHSILNVCVVVFFVSLRLHYHLIDS